MSLTSELGRPGTGLPTGAIPFVYGDPILGNFTQADLRQFIPAQPDDEQSVRVNVVSDGTALQTLASVINLPPYNVLRIRGLLRINNTDVSPLTFNLSLPSINVSNSGWVVGWFAPNAGSVTSFFDAATPLIINPTITLQPGQNILQFEHRFSTTTQNTVGLVSQASSGTPLPNGIVTFQGLIDFWVE